MSAAIARRQEALADLQQVIEIAELEAHHAVERVADSYRRALAVALAD